MYIDKGILMGAILTVAFAGSSTMVSAQKIDNRKEKTTFQTAGQWKPVTDVRSDVAIVYGAGDRKNLTFEQRVQSWRDKGYITHFMYTCNPDGYCGDEDNGQTSAWYVFSSLGFYPVCPGTDEYVLGAPLFKKATVHFENGNKLVINAPENSDKNRYIEAMTLNGKTYTKNYLKHASFAYSI